MRDFSKFTLGINNELLKIETREANYHACLALIIQGRRFVDIFSHDLEPDLYDQKDLVEAIKQLVINNRHARVRIVIAEPDRVIKRGNRLLELAFNLSSYIELRKPAVEHRDFNEALCLVDETGFLHRKNASRFEATVNFHDRRHSQSLLSTFEAIWQAARPDPNLRRVLL